MKSLKKIFSSFVTLTTILWSVGGTLAFPGVASAATLNVGDLIKASGPAVYLYAADGKRYVFPNEKTYFSWYTDFSAVKTITDAELAAILIGGNVTIRPGTKLVKITTDPKVYAVTGRCGLLHWVETEAVAKALYGDLWAQRVVDVPDSFFVNYTIGSSIPTAVHPDGSLVMYTGDTNLYLVWGGMKRLVTAAGKTANNLNSGYAVMTAISYPNGADVTGYESALADTACTTAAPSITGGVSVALAADTPAGVTVPKNSASVSMYKVNLTAGNDAALVTGLRIRRVGVGSTSDFSNVYLYDGNGTRLTTGRTINSSTNLVEFNGLNLNIAANSSISVVLTGDFSSPATTGGQHAFELSDAASVVISGTGAVMGSFPVRGNVFTVGTTSAGTLTVTKGTTPTNPNIGAVDAEISNFKLAASTNDIEVRRVTLLQAGDIANTDLKDLKLYQGSTVVATAAALVGDKIVLNFNPPFVIANGLTKTFSLHATIAGRAGRTIKTYVEYTTDVYAIDRQFNSGAAIDIGVAGTFDGSTTGSKFITVTTQGGQLTVAFNGPAASNVAKGQQDVKLYKFALTSPDNQLEIRKLRFRIDSTDGGQLEVGSTDFFTDIKVIDTDSGAVVAGPVSLPASAASGTSFILTDSIYVNAGQTRNFAITTDLANNTAATFVNHKYRACLSDDTSSAAAAATDVTTFCGSSDLIFEDGDVKIVSTGENLALAKIVPNSAIAGNELTVRAAGLTVSLASSPSAATWVKKQAMIPASGFVLSAGTESDILVRSIKLSGQGKTTAGFLDTQAANVITACALFDGTTQVGLSQSPDTVTGEMNITNVNVNVAKGTSKTLVAKCTADSTVDGTEDFFSVGIGSDADVTAEDQDNNDVTPSRDAGVEANADSVTPTIFQTVKASGVLTVVAGSQPSSTIFVGGNTKKYAEFTATAQYEDVTIDKITVSSTGDAANLSNVAIRVAGADKGSDTLTAGQFSFKDINLSSPITVPKDGSVTFEVWGTVASITSSSTASGATSGVARSGATNSLGIAAGVTATPWDGNYTGKFNVMALGAASGERLYSAGSTTVGNAMVIRKTKPTITKQSVSTNVLTSGSDTELYKFQMTPDAGGDVRWKQISFTVTTSSSAGLTNETRLNNFKFFKGSTQLVANTEVRILDGSGNDITGATFFTGGTVYVQLVNEEVVSGSGTLYTMRATPALSGSANTVSVQFKRSAAPSTVVTGYLAQGAGDVGYTIDTTPSHDALTGEGDGFFLWSDVSEPVHGFTTTTASSFDWTNDVYVEDMTQTQTLSKS